MVKKAKSSLRKVATNKKPGTAGRLILVALSLFGIAVMGYLTTLHDKDGPSVCDLNAKLSCSAVNNSEYSELLGIPVSYLGLGFFLVILGIALFKYTEQSLKAVIFMSIAFLGPGLYLTSLEVFVIGSICLFCELSKVLVLTIAITAIFSAKLKKDDLKQVLSSAIVVGLLLAGLVFMLFRLTSERVEPGQYNEFAQSVSDEGWVMYGSVTCQFCGRQRAAFSEESFEFIKEIECDPRNADSHAELCVAKEIDHTPTWVLEDEDGNTIKKLPSGMYQIDELAELTGIPLPE